LRDRFLWKIWRPFAS